MVENKNNNLNKIACACLSIPTSFIFFMLIDKMIDNMTINSEYSVKIQSRFVFGFIIGLVSILLAITVFAENSNMHNRCMQYSAYLTGIILILNSTVFNWKYMDDNAKMMILGIAASCIIVYSYLYLS
jgi:hypothetical protein